MYKPTYLTLKALAFVLAGSYFSACSGGVASSSFGSSGSSSTSIEVPIGVSDGKADPTFLFVGIDAKTNEIAHVHKSGIFGQNCSIDPKTTSPLQNISCIIDAPEGEIFFRGLSMVYNIPPGMCRFLRRKVYWFYNYPIGTGPSNISITRNYLVGVLQPTYTCTVDGVTTAAGTCGPFKEATVDVLKAAAECIYNTPDRVTPSVKHNGCLGTYHLTVTDVNTDATGTTTTTVKESDSSWGGSYGQVVAGAARISSWPTTDNGIPRFTDIDASLGINNASYVLRPPISADDEPVNSTTNLEIVNYYTPATHTHTGFVSATPSTLPYFIDPIDDLDGSFVFTGQPTYDFECLDQAYEIVHSVRVQVREWNTYQDFANYISSKGTVEIPDRNGTEDAASCVGISGPCNDMWNADDFVNIILGAPYDTTATGITKRKNYFPQIITR